MDDAQHEQPESSGAAKAESTRAAENLLADALASGDGLTAEIRSNEAPKYLKAATDAHAIFETRHGNVLSRNGVTPEVIAAIIRNEVKHRRTEDLIQDAAVRDASATGAILPLIDADRAVLASPFINEQTSIGPAQMQLGNIQRLRTKFPNELGGLRFVDALQVDKAALLVAAYLTDRLQSFEQGNFQVGSRQMDHIRQYWQSGQPADRAKAAILSYNPGGGRFTSPSQHDSRQYLTDVLKELERVQQGK